MPDLKINVFRISRGFKALQMSAYEPVRKKTGLTHMDLQLIYSLAQFNENETVGEMYKNTNFNKGQISVCVAKMLKLGFMERAENKGRFESYVLSKKGREVADMLEENTSRGRQRLLKGFTEEDVKQFESYLKRLLENVNDDDFNLNVEK